MGIEERVVQHAVNKGVAVSCAESCTGGLIAHRLTNVPGASEAFMGGLVAYSNAVKRQLLGVPQQTLEDVGAVSAEVATSMAGGARTLLGADYAVGVTGIAGPGGGTPEKPVGLVYIAAAGPDGTRVRRHVFEGPREAVKAQAAEAALRMMEELLA